MAWCGFVRSRPSKRARRCVIGWVLVVVWQFVLTQMHTHLHMPSQLTQLYHDELLHRPDMSLMVYGFVGDTDKPLLPASDLPTYDPASPYEHTAASDNEYSTCIEKCAPMLVVLAYVGCAMLVVMCRRCVYAVHVATHTYTVVTVTLQHMCACSTCSECTTPCHQQSWVLTRTSWRDSRA